MKSKGFTLVELLAVIVILTIIAFIVTPMISNVIDNARKATFEDNINILLKNCNEYIAKYDLIKKKTPIYPMTFECDGTTCKDANGDILELKGDIPTMGKIIIYSQSEIYSDKLSNGKWCASGYINKLKVEDSCDKLN
ncbi:MAG: type II secretion system protein [Bacilli bacterium]|nr:type II secretion system protein [Bacilli bacterium]